MRKKYKFVILLAVLSMLLCGCNRNHSQEPKAKVSDELQYLDKNIIYMINKLNNISFENYSISSEKVTLGKTSQSTVEETGQGGSNSQSSQSSGGDKSGGSSGSSGSTGNTGSQGQNSQESSIIATQMNPDTVLIKNTEDIEWDSIKMQIEIINSAWSVIILDLYNLNVEQKEILKFSTQLDNSIISIKNENKKESVKSLAELYSYIPKFMQMIASETSKQNVENTKVYIVQAYSLVETSDWEKINEKIDEALQNFKNVVNDAEYSKGKEYKVNKINVLLEELKNSLGTKDKDIFYINYKNVMENINSL